MCFSLLLKCVRSDTLSPVRVATPHRPHHLARVLEHVLCCGSEGYAIHIASLFRGSVAFPWQMAHTHETVTRYVRVSPKRSTCGAMSKERLWEISFMFVLHLSCPSERRRAQVAPDMFVAKLGRFTMTIHSTSSCGKLHVGVLFDFWFGDSSRSRTLHGHSVCESNIAGAR